MSEKPETVEKPTGLALLRLPFPANHISKLPKGTKAQNECPASEKVSCKVCGGWHHPKIIHLDYVGHAALTDRLLDADPMWLWEPLAMVDGLPKFDESGGLWIKLTVCGHTRLGYGHAAQSSFKDIGSREKEVIGDALRNAAMRFGAALDLWHKGDLHVPDVPDVPDVPEGAEPNPVVAHMTSTKITPTSGAKDNLSPEQRAKVDGIVKRCLDWLHADKPSVADAAAIADEAELDADETVYFWTFFDSRQRAAMKTEARARRERALKAEEATQA